MLNLLLAQPGFSWGPSHLNAYYFPYSIGCLWAKCLDNNLIVKNVNLLEMVVVREPISDIVDRYENIDVAGFSCYVWNYNYVNALSKAIKKKFPHCLIVYGGPEPEHTQDDIFHRKPWLDCVVIQEGEISFANILESIIDKKSLDHIPGLIINKDGKRHATDTAIRISDLSELPSPYIKGVFDHLFDKHPDITWTAIMETNRGCPYKCTYCDWGSLTLSKIKKFLLPKVEEEIKWMANKRIDYVNIADANFGIFVERDLEIAKLFCKYKKQTGWPKFVTTNWAKNAKKQVLDIAEEFKKHNISSSLNISLQSFNYETLTAVERNNFEMNDVEEMSKACLEKQLPINVELILGLPMETKQSWIEMFYKLFELDIHQNYHAQQLMIIENTSMNQHQLKQYGIKKFTRPIKFSQDNMENTEYATFVKSTNTMSYSDMLKCVMHTNWIYALHHSGLSSEQAIFLYKNNSIPYSVFYNNLIIHLQSEDFIKKSLEESLEQIKLAYSDINQPKLEQIDISLSGEFHFLEWNIIKNKIEKDLQQSISNFIKKNFITNSKLCEQLGVYADLSYLRYDNHKTFDEWTQEFDYNFYEINTMNKKIENHKHTYLFKKKLDKTFDNNVDYANYMIVRNKNIPTKNLITPKKI